MNFSEKIELFTRENSIMIIDYLSRNFLQRKREKFVGHGPGIGNFIVF